MSFNPHLVIDNKLCANHGRIAASTNKKRDIWTFDKEGGRRENSLGEIALYFSRFNVFARPVLGSPYPPVALVIGRLCSVAGCRVVTKSRLVIEHCTIFSPANDATFEIKITRCLENMEWSES